MEFKRISIDTSKHIFTIHGLDEKERPVLRREIRRAQVEPFFAKLAPTDVVLEACAGSHHRGRLLSGMGHRVKLIPPQDVKPPYDVDSIDPDIAPAVGTTVPGGTTFREVHLVMEMLHDSGLVSSLDFAELNPFLDERDRTATLITDLVASLLGRRVMDRPTRSF